MKKLILFSVALIVMAYAPAFGQMNILNKVKEKTKEVTSKTSGQTNQSGSSRNDSMSGVEIGNGKSASNFTGKGVEIVLATKDYNSFAEAKPNAVNRIVDGDHLWLYIKFDGTLANYVYKTPYADNDGNINYILFLEIGAQGEESSYDDNSLIFKKEQLNVSELKIALAPGAAGRNKSASMFLETVGGGQPGVWKNEIRVSNSPTVPRRMGDYLAKAPLTCDVSEGLAQYRKMLKNYASIAYVGTAEENKLPEPGKFVNAAIKTQIFEKLKMEGITPAKFYFTDDDWTAYSDSETSRKVDRKIYAAYTYQKGSNCFYGIAEVVQNYSYALATYGESFVTLRKDYPILCSSLK